jgi:hypothetical protein
MVLVPHPIITLKEGKAVENMEEILSRYNFEKQGGGIREPEYLLFKREDPSLVSIVNFYDESNNEKYTGVAIVSPKGKTNQEILAQLEERLGIQLEELRLRKKHRKEVHNLQKFYGNRFLGLVLG